MKKIQQGMLVLLLVTTGVMSHHSTCADSFATVAKEVQGGVNRVKNMIMTTPHASASIGAGLVAGFCSYILYRYFFVDNTVAHFSCHNGAFDSNTSSVDVAKDVVSVKEKEYHSPDNACERSVKKPVLSDQDEGMADKGVNIDRRAIALPERSRGCTYAEESKMQKEYTQKVDKKDLGMDQSIVRTDVAHDDCLSRGPYVRVENDHDQSMDVVVVRDQQSEGFTVPARRKYKHSARC